MGERVEERVGCVMKDDASRKIVCPFFREPCFEEECTAFCKKERLDPDPDGKPYYNIVMGVPYCNALNAFLPSRKEELRKGLGA